MSNNKWIDSTKRHTKNTKQTFKESLEDKNHRITYHTNQCDASKMYRGPNLLPHNHPAMFPGIPAVANHALQTPEAIEERKQLSNLQKDNHIRCLKNLRKK